MGRSLIEIWHQCCLDTAKDMLAWMPRGRERSLRIIDLTAELEKKPPPEVRRMLQRRRRKGK